MRWDIEATAKLREYTARKAAIVSLPLEIKRLEADCGRIRSASTDGTPVHGGGSTREDMLLSNICLREELTKQLADTQAWIEIIDRALAALTDDERLVLDRFYINPHKGSVDRLCDELSLERAGVYKRKDKALRHFTVVLYGKVES